MVLRGGIGSYEGKAPKPVLFLINHSGKIIFVMIFTSLIYSALIISHTLTEKAKIQENALLAGLVEEEWRDSARLQHYVHGLYSNDEGRTRGDLRNYIEKSLVEIGIEISRHSFKSISSPFASSNSSVFNGVNLYGIVRTFRTTSSEAILLAVPIRSTHIESIAIALAFAEFAKKQNYWARDLFFLFIDGGDKLAAEAWFSAYHGHNHPFFEQNDDIEFHGGSIIGAFVLDLVGSTYPTIKLQYNMINGKLPNMDLLNLLVLLVEKSGSVPSIHGVVHQNSDDAYFKSLNTVVRGLLTQVCAVSLDEVESISSVIGRYGVHAVTLYARSSNREKRHTTLIDMADMVRLIEGGMRSLNNLLEKLHHSYLLYILTSSRRFIPVSLYMPLIGFFLTSLLCLALRDWFAMGGASQLCAAGPTLLKLTWPHLLAFSFYGLQLFLYTTPCFSAKSHAVYVTLLMPIIIAGFCFIIPISAPDANVHFARFVITIELTLFLGALSLVHFSLAFLLCITLLPQAVSMLLLSSRYRKWIRIAIFISLHPFFILSMFLLLTNYDRFNHGVLEGWRSLTSQTAKIAFAHFVHGSWLLPIFTGPVLSICSAFNQIFIGTMKREESDENSSDSDKKLD